MVSSAAITRLYFRPRAARRYQLIASLSLGRHGGQCQWRRTPVSLKLEEIGLEQYASALIDDNGYDDLASLQRLTKHQAEEIADNVQMKPGHKRAFFAAFVAEAPVAVQPVSQPQRTYSAPAPEPLTMESVKDLSAFGTSVHYMKGKEDCSCCWSCVDRQDLTLFEGGIQSQTKSSCCYGCNSWECA